VWDVPMPVVAGERFAIKVGATGAVAGCGVEVSDAAGAVVASGRLGKTPLAGTEALHWVALDMLAPRQDELAEYAVRIAGRDGPSVATRFSVVATAKPEHILRVTVTEEKTKAALEGVEIRLGPFHARTDKAGRAEVRFCKGDYRLQLWRNGHIAQPTPIKIGGDVSLELTMLHVPEEHPDARWVR
jgi:hypothetical protein